jgi:hypothetical protein
VLDFDTNGTVDAAGGLGGAPQTHELTPLQSNEIRPLQTHEPMPPQSHELTPLQSRELTPTLIQVSSQASCLLGGRQDVGNERECGEGGRGSNAGENPDVSDVRVCVGAGASHHEEAEASVAEASVAYAGAKVEPPSPSPPDTAAARLPLVA